MKPSPYSHYPENPRTNPDKSSRTRNTFAVLGAILAVIAAATAFLVKKCTEEKPSDKPKFEGNLPNPELDKPSSAHAKNGSAHKHKHQSQRDTTQENELESAIILSDDDQLTLEEACQDIKDSVTYNDPGAIQDAFAAAEDLMPPASLESVHGFLQRMGRECGISEAQLFSILGKAIKQGDTRTAGFLNNYIVSRCADENLSAVMNNSKQLAVDFEACETPRDKCERSLEEKAQTACESIPWTDEESKISCLEPYWDNAEKQCETVPHDAHARSQCMQAAFLADDQRKKQKEENELTCPDRTAQAMGMDLKRIQSLNAEAVGNKLATLRLTLLNPTSELSEDLLRQYMAELRQFLISKDINPFLESLGLKEADEFLTKYIEEVARALRNRGKPYSSYAGLLESMWSLREVLHDED